MDWRLLQNLSLGKYGIIGHELHSFVVSLLISLLQVTTSSTQVSRVTSKIEYIASLKITILDLI